MARVLSHVHLTGSCSATAPAQGPALVVVSVVLVLPAPVLATSQEQHPSARLQGALLLVRTLANVLPGSFVKVRHVLQRARGSASHSLDLIRSRPGSRISAVKRAGHRSSGPSFCPYSPKCVE